jgi:hypothetical protein
MTGVEVESGDGWKNVGKVRKLFCKRVMLVPNTSTNGACAKELGTTTRKEESIRGMMKCWL